MPDRKGDEMISIGSENTIGVFFVLAFCFSLLSEKIRQTAGKELSKVEIKHRQTLRLARALCASLLGYVICSLLVICDILPRNVAFLVSSMLLTGAAAIAIATIFYQFRSQESLHRT